MQSWGMGVEKWPTFRQHTECLQLGALLMYQLFCREKVGTTMCDFLQGNMPCIACLRYPCTLDLSVCTSH
jgi:hypothetical protein